MELRASAKANWKTDLSIKISAKTVASMHLSEVATLIEKGLAEGVFVELPQERYCTNCGADLTGAFCRKCNQPADGNDLLDQDDGAEDRDLDDHSDSEDADDYGPAEEVEEDRLQVEASRPAFAKTLTKFLRSLEVSNAEIPLYLYLLSSVGEHQTGVDEPLPHDLVMAAADWAGKTEDYILALWTGKPFSQQDFDDVLEAWLTDGGQQTSGEHEAPFLEIRKVEGGYISIVHDSYEDVGTARGKRNAPVLCRGQEIPASVFLLNLRKRNQNLQDILEAIVDMRRDFLDAPTRDDALLILKERPLELVDIASKTGLDRGTVSRHFSTKAVYTPHGIFVLGDLTSPKSRKGKETTVSAIQDKILEIIRQGDADGSFHSDQRVEEILRTTCGVEASREYVQKIRKRYGISNSRERRARGCA
jgi:hypothetical protein